MVRPFDNTNQGMLIYQLLVWNAQGALAVTTLHISGSLITQPKAVSSTKIFIKICHPPPPPYLRDDCDSLALYLPFKAFSETLNTTTNL